MGTRILAYPPKGTLFSASTATGRDALEGGPRTVLAGWACTALSNFCCSGAINMFVRKVIELPRTWLHQAP